MGVPANVREQIPWGAKLLSKLVLSRLPANYQLWQHLRLFRHGLMDRPQYAYNVFRTHFDRCEFGRKRDGFVSLELGPGDSLFSAMVAGTLGASQSWLVDTGHYAKRDPAAYQQMGEFLRSCGFDGSFTPSSLEEVLSHYNARYETDGLAALRRIPSASVDLAWSHAVLEHIRKADFGPMMRELRRVLRPDGICSHRVDLRDHLGGALNNLRFPESIWEAEWMAKSGFYTNRIGFDGMLKLFEQAGFEPEVVDVGRWEELPTPQQQLAEPFRSAPLDSLLVRNFDVVLRPR